MGDFTVNVRQKPMDFNRWQLGLCYRGSGQLSPRFDHPFPSFAETFAISHGRMSCGWQTHLVM